MTDTSFFANGNMPYIERARLMLDIDLAGYITPLMPTVPWSNFELELNDHGTYNIINKNGIDVTPTMTIVPDYIEAPFFIPILAGLYKEELPANRKVSSPNKRGFKGDKLLTSAIESTNYIKLKIPRYIITHFLNGSPASVYWSDFELEANLNGGGFVLKQKSSASTKISNIIKKGTEFLIASVGGQLLAENIRIIGLYTI